MCEILETFGASGAQHLLLSLCLRITPGVVSNAGSPYGWTIICSQIVEMLRLSQDPDVLIEGRKSADCKRSLEFVLGEGWLGEVRTVPKGGS